MAGCSSLPFFLALMLLPAAATPRGGETVLKAPGLLMDRPGKGQANSLLYRRDFDFLKKTIKRSYPALAEKGIDWERICREWEPRFRSCRDDKTHILNACRLLAVLRDSHTGITRTKIPVKIPSFEGLYGGGLWIAAERGRLVLRALMEGHPLAGKIERGAELLLIDGRPAKIVHEEVARRLEEWIGWSSPHFRDARLSFQFFPFSKDPLPAVFLNPGGSVARVRIPRWGPGGRGLSRLAATMPKGVAAGKGAAAAKVAPEIGYIRITGGMDESTKKAFFYSFDTLRGVKGIILDCRGMGGGGDRPAWEMAGRFFAKAASLGRSGRLEPSGPWQFEGPVVMLQDEREISSAETFTWAMTETGRAVSVGRPTGGAAIIPKMYDAPSGLFSFRMGSFDRPTPIRGIKTEGEGTPPDVFVPYEPVLLDRYPDPAFAVARDVLLLLLGGASQGVVVDYYGGMLGVDPERVRRSFKKFQRLSLPRAKKGFCDVTKGVVEAMADWEIRLCNRRENPMPDFAGAKERLEKLAAIASLAGLDRVAAKAAKAPGKWKKEIAAQKAYAVLISKSFPPAGRGRKAYLARYGATRYGKAVAKGFSAKKK